MDKVSASLSNLLRLGNYTSICTSAEVITFVSWNQSTDGMANL